MSIIVYKLLKTLLIITVTIVVLFLNYLLFAWFLSTLTTTPKPITEEKTEHFFVATNGVHVDIILPVSMLDEVFINQLKVLEGTRYIGMGWGDEGFYLKTPSWAELDWRVGAAAIFLPTATLMHVTHYHNTSSKWKKVNVCTTQRIALLKYIKNSFKYSIAGELCYLPNQGYTSSDFFYRAKGYYTGLYTCNVWANQALKSAQVKTAIWAPFDKGVMKHLK